MSNTSVKAEIAKNLAYYRKKNNFTQKDLADKLGVKYNTVSSWENGTNSIDIEVLFQICDILNITVADMYGNFSKNSDDNILSEKEKTLIEKYRKISPVGQEVVDTIIDIHLKNKS